MCAPHPSRLSVEVDRDVDPITGQVQALDGPWLPFVGWLGLISALETLIAADQAAQSHSPQGDS